MKRDTRTPTFWTSADPPPMLPRGQLDLPLVQAPKVEPPELTECNSCGAECIDAELRTDEHGFPICEGCLDDVDGFDATFGPEDDGYLDGGE